MAQPQPVNNYFDQFDQPDTTAAAASVPHAPNYFDQFDAPPDQLVAQSPILGEQKNIAKGVVRGLEDVPEGGYQLAVHGVSALAPEGSAVEKVAAQHGHDVDEWIKNREADYLKDIGGKAPSIDVGRMIGNVAIGAPLTALAPGATAEALWARILSGLGTGAVTGAAQPVTNPSQNFWEQKALQTGAGAVGGAGGAIPVGAAARTISGATNPNVKLLTNAGVSPTVGQIVGKWFGPLEEKLGSIPGVGDVIANARVRATEDMNRAAINRSLSHVGESLDSATPLGREAISEMHDKIGGAYDKLLPNLTWQADNQFVGNFGNIHSDVHAFLPETQQRQFDNSIKEIFHFGRSSGGLMSGQDFKDAESKLGSLARQYSNAADPDQRGLGQAFQKVQAEFRAGLERSNPQYAGQLRNINAAYADALRVQTAAGRQGADEGLFSAPQLASAVRQMDPSLRKGAYARGEARMQDLSDAAKAVLGNKVPDSGTAGRSLAALAAGAFAGGAGAEHVMPHITLPVAGGIAAGLGAYTPIGQRSLATLLASRPSIAAPIAGAVRSATPVGTSALANVLARQVVPP